ncbi:MAG: hypothetical protein ACR2MN_00095 [Acidimicrobiales bacterium]
MDSFSVWFARRRVGPDGEFEFYAIHGTQFPDSSIQGVDWDQPPIEAGSVVYRALYRADGHPLAVKVMSYGAKSEVRLWYVSCPEPDARPPAHTLIAFSTPDFSDGVFVEPGALEALGIDKDQQVGAFRWWPESGQAHQVYVAPMWRRRGLASKIVLAASGFGLGWGLPRLWGIGQLTDLGAAWTGSAIWHSRVPTWTERLPPMTPPEDTADVPRRNLLPDDSGEPEPIP